MHYGTIENGICQTSSSAVNDSAKYGLEIFRDAQVELQLAKSHVGTSNNINISVENNILVTFPITGTKYSFHDHKYEKFFGSRFHAIVGWL